MLPESFNSYFIELDNVHINTTPSKNIYTSESEKKNSSSYLFESAEIYSKRVSSLFIFSIQNILQNECFFKIYSIKNFDFFLFFKYAST